MKEMGPGARWEMIDNVCGFHNWRKMVELENMLLHQMLEVIPEAIAHHEDFCKFTSGLLAQCPADVSAWRTMLEEWEVDHSKPDPYVLPKSTVTLAEVHLKLAKEEQARVQAMQDAQLDVSPGTFLLGDHHGADSDTALHEGLRAFAMEHAAMERNLAANFDSKWTVVWQRMQTILRDLNTAVQVLDSSLDAASEQDNDIESEAVDLDA
ncbi:hypothetical protein BKA93DRAFT_831262 [Sparassis latifolia]